MSPTVFRWLGAASAVVFLIYGVWALRAGKIPSRGGGWVTRRENPIMFRIGLGILAASVLLGVLVAVGWIQPAQPL